MHRPGLVPKVHYLFPRFCMQLDLHIYRCTSPPNDLDDPGGSRRSHRHTDILSEGCTLKELWDNYGIVGDLEVSVPFRATICNENLTLLC